MHPICIITSGIERLCFQRKKKKKKQTSGCNASAPRVRVFFMPKKNSSTGEKVNENLILEVFLVINNMNVIYSNFCFCLSVVFLLLLFSYAICWNWESLAHIYSKMERKKENERIHIPIPIFKRYTIIIQNPRKHGKELSMQQRKGMVKREKCKKKFATDIFIRIYWIHTLYAN